MPALKDEATGISLAGLETEARAPLDLTGKVDEATGISLEGLSAEYPPETVFRRDYPERSMYVLEGGWQEFKKKVPDAERERVENALGVAARFNIPPEVAYNYHDDFTEALKQGELAKGAATFNMKAYSSLKAGVGDVYSTIGHAMKWLDINPGGVADDYLEYGARFRMAYIPPLDDSEFSARKMLNPEWFATTVLRSVPFTLSLIPAAVGGAYGLSAGAGAVGIGAFGKLVLGSIGAGVLSRTLESTMEAGNTYEEALKRGMTDDEADRAANDTFWGNMALIGLDATQFFLAFTPLKLLGGVATRTLARRVAATAGKIAFIGATEAGEEAYQDVIQRHALGDPVKLDPQMKESAAVGAIFGVGLGGFGSVWTGLKSEVQKDMPEEVQKTYTDARKQAVSGGATPEQADLKALDAVAETPEGKTHIEGAMKDLKTRAEGEGEKVAQVAPETVEAPVISDEEIDAARAEVSQIEDDEELGRSIAGRAGEPEMAPEIGDEGFIDLTAEVSLAPVLERLRTLPATAQEAASEVQRVANSVYAEGKTTLQDFKARMKEVLGDLYEKFKAVIDRVYKAAKAFNERLGEVGAIGGRKAKGFEHAQSKFSSLADKGERFEIDDSQAEMKIDFVKSRFDLGRGDLLPLNKVIKHPALFENYPELKKLEVLLTEYIDADARYIGKDKGFPFGRIELNITLTDNEAIKKNLFHEIQHAIQETEGFARGGSPEQMAETIYIQRKDEISALAIKQSKEGLSKGEEYRLYLLRHGIGGSQQALDAYLRLAGEIEAREVGDRIKLTPEQRQATLIYAGQGIPLAEWIVQKTGEGQSFSIDKEAKARIREITGQIKPQELRNLGFAFRKADQAARQAERAGDKAGVARERVRMKEMLTTAKQKATARAEVRKLKAQIKKEVTTTKIKKQAGKPKGKFTADFQAIFDTWQAAFKATPTEAEEKLQTYLRKFIDNDQLPPQKEVVEAAIFSLVLKLDTMKATELQEILEDIKAMKSEGRLMRALEDFHYEEKIADLREQAIDVNTGGKGLPKGLKTTGLPDEKLSWAEWLAKFTTEGGYIQVGWQDLMDIMSGEEKGSIPGKSRLNKMANVRKEANAVKEGTAKWTLKVSKMARKAFGFKNDHEMMSQFNKDKEIIEIGTFINAENERTTIRMSRSQARKRWMEMQDPTLSETFREGMAYTDEIIDAIGSVLTRQDEAFAEAQLQFYRDYYPGVNEVYRQLYGVDLPFNEFYSPIKREGVSAPEGFGFGDLLQDISFRASAAPSATKSRVKNINRILEQNDLNVLEQHIAEMEHFKAWATKVRELNAIFNDPQVKTAIRMHYGKHMNAAVEHFIKKYTRGGIDLSTRLGFLDKWRARTTRAVLAGKAAIGLKQLTSFIAYAEKMPVNQFMKYVVAYWDSPVENFKFLKDSSTLFKYRGQHMERDVKTALTGREYQSFRRTRSFMDMLMLNVQMGDQGAIAVGGWAYYKYLTEKQGMSHADAITEFEEFTAMTQQSADLSDLSVFQSMGSVAKLFSMFMSAPNLYMRKEYGALRNIYKGRGSVKQHVKVLMLYHLLIPILFQLASDGFTWDWKEQKRAMIFGSLNGIFIIGDGLEFMFRKAMGLPTYSMELAIFSGIKDAGAAISEAVEAIAEDGFDAEDTLRAIRGLAGAVGSVTGMPLKQSVDIAKGGGDLISGEFEKGIYELLGYTPYTAEKITEGEGGR